MTYRGAWQIGELDLVAYRKLGNQYRYQYSSLFATICDYSLLYLRIWWLFGFYHQPSSLATQGCITVLLSWSNTVLTAKIFFGILDLTMGCLIRLCHDVNDDVAIFTKLSLVFPCENKKPQANFKPRKHHYFHLQNKHLNFLILTFFAM